MKKTKPSRLTISYNHGYTLLELLIVLGFVGMIALLTYQLLSFSYVTFKKTSNQAIFMDEARKTIRQLEQEIKRARKATDILDECGIVGISEQEIKIYTDLNQDEIPECIHYRLDEGKLKKSIAYAKNNTYPYLYETTFSTEEVLMSKIANTDVFTKLEKVSPENKKDQRQKLQIRFVLQLEEDTMAITRYVMSKSREKAD